MSRQLWDFHGGIHPPEQKDYTRNKEIEILPVPKKLVLPLQQQLGAVAKELVKVGDTVLKGQKIAEAEGAFGVPIHAPTSGVITTIERVPVIHTSGLPAPAIVLESDGHDTWIDREPVTDWQSLSAEVLLNKIQQAGIVGLGGAGFPSHIKLNPGKKRTIDILVINGAECEPYITCDDLLMHERAKQVITGIAILAKLVSAKKVLVGIEDNKGVAIAEMQKFAKKELNTKIEIVPLPVKYPTGGEKQLIKILTGKEVPSKGIPADIGMVVQNVATAMAVYKAVVLDEPLISRIVTLTGAGIGNKGNLEVLFGTSIKRLLEWCEKKATMHNLIAGGPMMGVEIKDVESPITKTTNCIIAATLEELITHKFVKDEPVRACIRCGECTKVCPTSLLPQQLYWYSRSSDLDKVEEYNLFDCIECGCCAWVCPSNIPLVEYYRYAKGEWRNREQEQQQAELARKRHEFRENRIAKEKAKRAEMMRKKREAIAAKNKKQADGGADKKAAVAAAVARAKAKKDKQQDQQKNEQQNEQQSDKE